MGEPIDQNSASQRIIIDEITLVCCGCRRERKIPLTPHLHGAEEVIAWLKTHPTPCGCGSSHCDAKMRLVRPS